MGRKDSHPSKSNKKGGGPGGKSRTSAGRNDTNGQQEPSNSRRSHPSTNASDETEAKDPSSSSSSYSGPNRPRNWLLHDATSDVAFRFDVLVHRGASKGVVDSTCEIRVQQTPNEDTWPGGALWDSGVLLAQLLAVLPLEASAAASSSSSRKPGSPFGVNPTRAALGLRTVTLTSYAAPAPGAAAPSPSEAAKNVHRHPIRVPTRLLDCEAIAQALGIQPATRSAGASSSSSLRSSLAKRLVPAASPRPISILELGCGVGLTGMVASVSLRASVTLLTDLSVVVEKVTQPNLQKNEKVLRQHGAGVVRAVPLCWGCERDHHEVRQLLRKLAVEVVQPQSSTAERGRPSVSRSPPPGTPDWILVGDVAYQHRPGAPSHFDELLSTLLYFTDPPPPSPPDGNDDDEEVDSFAVTPIVVFGTRIRMPASVDLLDLLLEHFDPVIDPPLEADEINSAFFGQVKKHNMTVHFLRRKAIRQEEGCGRESG